MSRGQPLLGDRGAHAVIAYGSLHADDIEDSTLRRHCPLPAGAGGYIRDDGTDWQRVSEVPLADIASYVRGSIARGGAADWEVHAAKTNHFILVGDGTDIVSKAFDWDDMAAGAAADMVHDHGSAAEGGELSASILADYARGSIIRGGAADWEAYSAKAAGNILVGDGTDVFLDPLVSFGAGAPATTYPGKIWVDTS